MKSMFNTESKLERKFETNKTVIGQNQVCRQVQVDDTLCIRDIHTTNGGENQVNISLFFFFSGGH